MDKVWSKICRDHLDHTDNELKVMRIIERNGPLTPTRIGCEAGKQKHSASSWACKILKILVLKGWVVRIERDRDWIVYDLAEDWK